MSTLSVIRDFCMNREPIATCIVGSFGFLLAYVLMVGLFSDRSDWRRSSSTHRVSLPAAAGGEVSTHIRATFERTNARIPLLPAPIMESWSLTLDVQVLANVNGRLQLVDGGGVLAPDLMDAKGVLTQHGAETIVRLGNLTRRTYNSTDAEPAPLEYAADPVIRPLWFGVAVNVLCLLIFVPAFCMMWAFGIRCERRRWRRVKGVCPACGYDATSFDVCPECGESRREGRTH